jgi:recombination protein RecR
LIDQFERLPGIGPRTAQRLALHLLRQPEEQIHSFADALFGGKESGRAMPNLFPFECRTHL